MRRLSERPLLTTTHLRIDAIEQAMREADVGRLGAAGYAVAVAVADAVAEADLRLGHAVVADCVNPVRESRLGWRAAAARASAQLLDIHLVCSDEAEHRPRVESRTADIDGHVLPSWEDVARREFEPRDDEHVVFDTSGKTPEELVELCAACVARP